jgi:hypothetical protein
MERIAKMRAPILNEHVAAVTRYSHSRSNWSGAIAFSLLLLVPFVGWGAHVGWNRHLGLVLETWLLDEADPLSHRYVLIKSGAEHRVRRIDRWITRQGSAQRAMAPPVINTARSPSVRMVACASGTSKWSMFRPSSADGKPSSIVVHGAVPSLRTNA